MKVLGVKRAIYRQVKEVCERELLTVSDILYEIITDFLETYRQFRGSEGEDARMFPD